MNHPGGSCWFQQTPDIRPGDRVQIEIMANATDATRVGRIDETTVANVTARRPVATAADTVQVHGTAQDAAGNPLPIAELEHRLVAPGKIFAADQRRALRATSPPGRTARWPTTRRAAPPGPPPTPG